MMVKEVFNFHSITLPLSTLDVVTKRIIAHWMPKLVIVLMEYWSISVSNVELKPLIVSCGGAKEPDRVRSKWLTLLLLTFYSMCRNTYYSQDIRIIFLVVIGDSSGSKCLKFKI